MDDAPKPVATVNQFSYDYNNGNGVDYKIEIKIQSKELILRFKDNNSVNAIPNIYTTKFTNDNLIAKNKFFKIYDSLDEICTFLCQIISQKKLIITLENDRLKTTWVFIKGVSEDKIIIDLLKEEVDNNQVISILINEVTSLKKDNQEKNEKINNLESKIDLLEERIKKLEELISKNSKKLQKRIVWDCK